MKRILIICTCCAYMLLVKDTRLLCLDQLFAVTRRTGVLGINNEEQEVCVHNFFSMVHSEKEIHICNTQIQ